MITNIDQEKPRRGRGRPKKAANTNERGGNVEEEGGIKAAPRKPGRKPKEKEAAPNVAPARKRGRPPKQKNTEPIPREPLPDRSGRNVNPAGQKAKRRSPQEVAAEREAKKRALDDKIKELENAKRLLAETNTYEDIQDTEMYDENPQRLSAAIRKRQHAELEGNSDDGESFDFRDIDAMESSESSEEDEPVKETMLKKVRKVAKGALRKEVQDMAEMMGGGRDSKKLKMTVVDTQLDHAPRKYQNSGLRKDYNKPSRGEEVFDPFQSGGLDDKDAYSVRPPLPHTRAPVRPHIHFKPEDVKGLKRDHHRRNDVVHSQLENESDPQLVDLKPSKPKGTETVKPTRRQLRSVTPVPGPTGNGLGDVSEMYIKDRRWARIFIPTLTHALYISREPFKDFTLDSRTFLSTVQTIFNLTFSTVDFSVSSNDQVMLTAYNRVKTRKSMIGSDVLKHIENFFNKVEFAGQPEKVREYVHWALRPGGPAYYRVPTPKDCIVSRKEIGYIPPEGFLESEFVAQTAKNYLRHTKNSLLEPPIDMKHPPKGLYVLILLAVERGFTAHLKGNYATPPLFNHDNCWKAMGDFLFAIDKVKEERWASILHSAMALDDELEAVDTHYADRSMISAFRAEMYISSSP